MSVNSAWVLLLVAASVWTGRVLQKQYWPQEGWATVALLATSIIVTCFQVLGYAALITQYPCFTVMWAAVLSLVPAIITSAVHRDTVATMARLPRLAGWRPDRHAVFFVGGGVILYAILVAGGAIGGPWGWDATAYHVPVAITWFRIGLPHDPSLLQVIGDAQHPAGLESTAMFPMTMSLFDLLAIAAAGVRFTAISQAPFALMAAAFVGGIARELGAARVDRRLASLAFLATPIIAFQAITPYADLFVACWFLAATYHLLVFLRARPADLSALPLIGLSLGLIVGAKYSAVPYAAMMGGLVVLVLLLRYFSNRPPVNVSVADSKLVLAASPPQHRPGLSIRWGIRAIGLLLITSLLVTSFWYVRSWVVVGSPTYPVRVSVAGKQLFPGIQVGGVYPEKEIQHLGAQTTMPELRWLMYPWQNTAVSEEDGTGLPFALLLPGAAIVVLARTVRGVTRRRPRDRGYIVLLVLTVGTIGIWWQVTSRDPRYILWLWGFVFAIGASIVSGVGRRHIVDLRTVLIGALLFSVLAMAGPLYSRVDNRWGNPCTYAEKRLVDFIETLPDGSTILNNYGEMSSSPCSTILAGKRLQHRVIGGARYFDPTFDPEIVRNRLIEYGVDYVLYWRPAGAPLRPAYSDTARYPVVFVDQYATFWNTVQRVLR